MRIFKGEGNKNIEDLFNYAENFNEFRLRSFLCDLTRYLKKNSNETRPRVLFHNFLKDRIFEYFGNMGVDYKILEALDSGHLEVIFKNIDNLMAYCEVLSPDKTIKDVLLLNQDDLNKAGQ